MASETFFCCMYLPAKEIDVVIKDRDMVGVNYLRFMQPNTKHLSINTIGINEKRIRKVKDVRNFDFPKSEFKWF
jgi:hypothetical protein